MFFGHGTGYGMGSKETAGVNHHPLEASLVPNGEGPCGETPAERPITPTSGNGRSRHVEKVQNGPLSRVKRVITPFIYRDYNPSYPFIRPFIGVITPFITPSCVCVLQIGQCSGNYSIGDDPRSITSSTKGSRVGFGSMFSTEPLGLKE